MVLHEKLHQREPSDFSELMRENKASLERMLLRRFGFPIGELDLEELVQRSFVNAFLYFDQFDQNKSFLTWVYSIAINQVHKEIRSPRRRKESLVDVGGKPIDIDPQRVNASPLQRYQPNPEEALATKELFGILKTIKGEDLNLLLDAEEMSRADLAEKLNLSEGRVKNKIVELRKTLRTNLQEATR